MDKVLKRRLIGASILIALAVIFLPMLLVAPEPDLDDRRLSEALPEMPDSDREVRRIPLDPDLARVPPARVEPADRPTEPMREPVVESEPESSMVPEPAPERAAPPREIVLNPEAVPSDEAPASTEPEATVAESTESTPPASEPEPTTTSPPADPLLRPAPEPAPVVAPAVADGTWVVQVASFGAADASRTVTDRLEALGHPVATDEVVRGETLLYRIRTGPYASREQAETARGQIAATVAGVQPIVREIDAGALEVTPGFAVQVGSFASEENAERETTRLRTLGFEAFRMSQNASGRSIWKVLVGTVDDRASAEALRDRLAAEAGVEGLVVSHP